MAAACQTRLRENSADRAQGLRHSYRADRPDRKLRAAGLR